MMSRKDDTRMEELQVLVEVCSKIKKSETFFKVRVWTERGAEKSTRDISVVPRDSTASYALRDEITINFAANQDCYLTLINIGTSGKMAVLFPNTYIQDNFIHANQTYIFPAQHHPFRYKLTGPSGIERIKAIATIEPVNLIEADFSKLGDLGFYSADRQQTIRDIEVVSRQINSAPLEDWAEDTCIFEVKINMASILFLAADPADASRLRLGEEFREIKEKLKLVSCQVDKVG